MSPRQERQPRRQKEVRQFTPIETICHGVEVVQIVGGPRRYHVTYEKGTEEPKPSHYFFDTVPEVLKNLERVVQSKLGLLVSIPSGTSVFIPGETQRMSELSRRLTTLAGMHLALTTLEQSAAIKEEIASCRGELVQVRNVYKVAAEGELAVAQETKDPRIQLDALLAGDLDIVNKNAEDLRIAQGTLARWRIVFAKRDRNVEDPIVKRYKELVEELARLKKGALDVRAREQAARHISGSEGLLAQLNRITWPEYWQRIQDRDVQRLSDFGAHIRAGNDGQAIKILDDAILKLWRVGEERVKRDRGEREK